MNNSFNNSYIDDLRLFNTLKSYANLMFKEKKYEKALKFIYYAASFAWGAHFGKWYDSDLENLLSKIGILFKEKKSSRIENHFNNKRLKIAYIASILRDYGGHNIVLKDWTKFLSEKYQDQELFVTKTDMKTLHYPALKESLINCSVKIYDFPTNISFLERILKLKDFLEQTKPEIIFLFTHPNDITFIPAIAALSYKPMILFFNHGDHVFWLGRNISDKFIEFREDGAKFSKIHRKIKKPQYIIPLTSNITPVKISKQIFGIPENSTLSISVGGFMKVKTLGDFNYFKTIEEILKKNPNHYHMFVTVPPPLKVLNKFLSKNPDIRNRFIINGPFANLAPIYSIGDFLIDTFPIGGGIVLVDAMACGLPIVAFRHKKFSIVSDGGVKIPDFYTFVAKNHEEVISFISQMINNPKLRKELSDQLLSYFKQNFSPEAIKKLLFEIVEDNENEALLFSIQMSDQRALNYDIQ